MLKLNYNIEGSISPTDLENIENTENFGDLEISIGVFFPGIC